ncbi:MULTISPECIES: ABC transporter substrate-binding protein [Terrabacteria group]|uniref:ABC transporter substrate-binding protein n=1 Tax=Bacillati TaxID=1783272 RepID=UPI001C6E05F6|nr:MULTISPECIES: ABC transporter substrate-binding protein [Terrabacteria group]MBW9212271.1 ABC transporter substrate-binding protein [Trueperella sp. zg.1013]
MKKIVKFISVALALSLLTACGNKKVETTQIDAKQKYGCNKINVYNASEYIADDTIKNFEKKYNAHVQYDLFDSNEMLHTKLLGGSSYDVIVPSDYMVEQLLKEDYLQKLDKSLIPNLSNVNPSLLKKQKDFDSKQEYSVPYFWGNVGIVYNKKKVNPADVEKLGWNVFRDTKYKGKIFFYDSQRDGFMVALKALGYSMNTKDDGEIKKAYAWLQEMNKTMAPSYVTDEVIDDMVNNKKDIAMMYSGDASYVLLENEELDYFQPKQGTNIWTDAMVIPKNASCPALAHAFINEMVSKEVQKNNSKAVGYTAVIQEVEEEIANNEYDGIASYRPRTNYNKDEVFHYNPGVKEKLSDLWTKVKVQK